MASDCAISYAPADVDYAERMCDQLVAAGLSVWFDRARLNPGCDWLAEIASPCKNGRVVLVVLTPRWKLSERTRYETYGASSVVPVLFEGTVDETFTPPLRRFEGRTVQLTGAAPPDWARLVDAVRLQLDRVPEPFERITLLGFPPNPCFVGREATLNELHEKLFLDRTTAPRRGHTQVMAGPGGVGKTTLARRYAERFWRCYPQRFWVNCDTPESVVMGFAAICDLLFPERAKSGLAESEKAAMALRELQQAEGRPLRLLVLDDAIDEESVLRWIPVIDDCHTIITSRFNGWSAGIGMTRVARLEEGPARELLLGRARLTWETLPAGERDACDQLASTLGYLPLALELAAAYVGKQRCGFSGYLRVYERSESQLHSSRTSAATEYPAAVFHTWRTAVDRLPEGARAILGVAAWMSTTPIPVALFVDGSSILSGAQWPPDPAHMKAGAAPKEFAVREWIGALLDYSMIRRGSADDFTVHSFVQAVERDQAPFEDRSVRIEQAAGLVVCFAPAPTVEAGSWPVWDLLFPHADTLLAHMGNQLTGEAAQLLSRRIIVYSSAKGDHDQALEYSEGLLRAIRASTSTGGYASGLVHYGECLRRIGRPAEAAEAFRKALDIDRGVYPATHIILAKALNFLGMALIDLGEFAEAAACFSEGLEIAENLEETESDTGWNLVTNLATCLTSGGDYPAAEPLLRAALCTAERLWGPSHRRVARSLDKLARSLLATNRLSEAEPMLRRALAIDETSYGPDHPRAATRLNNLAVLLQEMNRLSEAEPLMHRALEIFETSLGQDHPNVAKALCALAQLLQDMNRLSDAELLTRRALAIFEASLGPNHLSVATALSTLAQLLHDTNRLPEAEPLMRRALGLLDASCGPEHPDVATELNNLALLLQDTGRLSAAESLLRCALAIDEASLGLDHPTTLVSIENLADVLEQSGRGDEARSLRLRRIATVSTRQDVMPLELRTVALDCYLLGDYAQSTTLLERVLQAGFEVPSTLCHLARIALATGDAAAAREHAEQAWQHRAEGPAYIVPRILWLRLAVEMAEGAAPAPDLLGLIKTALLPEGACAEWAMDPVLAALEAKLSAEGHALLTALVAALSSREKAAELDVFAGWREVDLSPRPTGVKAIPDERWAAEEG